MLRPLSGIAALLVAACASVPSPRAAEPLPLARDCHDPVTAIGARVSSDGPPGEVVACARDAHGLRISYRTTRGDGAPAIATARVVLPSSAIARPAPFAVVAHGTVGLADRCAPSLGSPDEMTRTFAAHGWPVIAPDYAGLGSPGVQGYGDNEDTARSVLDAARAMRALLPRDALSGEAVLVGHSQGGGAVLSAQAIARRYLEGEDDVHLAAVIALAPGWVVRAQLEAAAGDPEGALFGNEELSLAVSALFLYAWHARTYGEARAGEGFARAHREALTRAIEESCVSSLIQSVPRIVPSLRAMVDETLHASLLACAQGRDEGCDEHGRALFEWSRANLLDADPEGAPVHVLHGTNDGIITPERTRAIVDQLRHDGLAPSVCALDADHLSIVPRAMPQVLAIAEARAAGQARPQPSFPSCSP